MGGDLKIGLSMAQQRAHPLDTHSLAFRVRLGSLPNTSRISCSRAGTLELLPTISTDEISSLVSPDLSRACRVEAAPVQFSSLGRGRPDIVFLPSICDSSSPSPPNNRPFFDFCKVLWGSLGFDNTISRPNSDFCIVIWGFLG